MNRNGSLLLILAFIEGASVMMAELVSAKMLAPIYGSSLYVWGSIIGMTLLSLTAGYYLGGWLSLLRRQRQNMVLWLMLLAALLIAIMPHLAGPLLLGFVEMGTIQAIILLTAILLAPPLLLLGATSPLIISLIAERVEDAGRAAGRVYGVSTIGGILGTFAAGFFLIPGFGLTTTALLAGTLLLSLPLGLLLGQRQFVAVLFPALAIVFLALRPGPQTHPDVEVVYQSEGLLGQLKVIDFSYQLPDQTVGRTDRILFVNRTAQTWINRDTGEPVWDYVIYLQSIASLLPEGSRALLLGLGGGTVAHYLQDIGLVVDSVELDARIAQAGFDYFDLRHSGDIFIDDGRHFLRATDRTYDLVIFDVFQAEVPPAHMLTLETFSDMRRMLNPGGFFVVNYSGYLSGSTGRGARSIYRTLTEAVDHVEVLPTRDDEHTANNLFIASFQPMDFSAPRMPLVVDGRAYRLVMRFLDPSMINLDDTYVLRDNQPVLEKLNLEAAALWRQTYYEYFTRPFLEKGVRIFE